jgi:serine protease Do
VLSKCCNFGFSWTMTQRMLLLPLSLCIVWSAIAAAQDFPQSSQDRTSFRPVLPESKVSRSTKSPGFTSVALEPGIGRIFEPRNQADLISLEKQQTKVAEKVNLVTVNIQHGTTQGSGVIITGDGYILTAAHVASRPNKKLSILLHDGTRLEGISMGVNRNMDAGLVRITTARDITKNPWPHASLGTSSSLQQGQCWMPDRPAVVRIGRLLKIQTNTLFTDCSLIGGDSGGPLFDLEGKLIGIHSRIGVDVEENMHVPVDVFDESWSLLVQNKEWGSLPGFKPAIGVRGTSRTDSETNCVIASVEPKGPADKAGIRAGDVILKFDGQAIKNFDDLISAVNSVTPGEQVNVELRRDLKSMSLRLIVGVKE